MGYYIETGTLLGKSAYLVREHAARVVSRDEASAAIDDSAKAIICVVNNGPFEAAAFCYSAGEFRDFSLPEDGRPKVWLLMDRAKAEELSGYK
jgi:hypothetical protein